MAIPKYAPVPILIQRIFDSLHFIFLGNLPASVISFTASLLSFLSLRYRSWVLGTLMFCVNLGLGSAFVRTRAGWLPVIGSCIATVAIFTLKGIPFRAMLLASTLLWLANNLITGSIGGTLLEVANATLNITTMIRLARARGARTPACRVESHSTPNHSEPRPLGSVFPLSLPPRP
jgi:hypothetical protein